MSPGAAGHHDRVSFHTPYPAAAPRPGGVLPEQRRFAVPGAVRGVLGAFLLAWILVAGLVGAYVVSIECSDSEAGIDAGSAQAAVCGSVRGGDLAHTILLVTLTVLLLAGAALLALSRHLATTLAVCVVLTLAPIVTPSVLVLPDDCAPGRVWDDVDGCVDG